MKDKKKNYKMNLRYKGITKPEVSIFVIFVAISSM